MKVVIVGANGYVGANFVEYFSQKGASLSLYDRQSDEGRSSPSVRPSIMQVNITDSRSVASIDWHCDAVIMLAGLTGTHQSIEQAVDYIQVNEIGLVNVLQAILQSGARPHILYPSTRLVYKGKKGLTSEDDAKEAKTVYAVSKLSAEHLLNLYASYYGIHHTVFRICVPYGNLVPVPFSFGTVGFMMRQAEQGSIELYGGGEPRRTFTHIEDIAGAFFAAIHNPICYGETFNIGGEDLSLLQVASLLSVETGAKISTKEWPLRDSLIESGDTVFDDSKIIRMLGYACKNRISDWIQKQYLHS